MGIARAGRKSSRADQTKARVVAEPRRPAMTSRRDRLAAAALCLFVAIAAASLGLVTTGALAAGGDATPPTTTATGVDSLWHGSAVTVSFTAVDDPGGSGMTDGAAKTEYQLDAAAWVTGASCTVAAPADHSGDGRHTVSYRSTDAAGNVEAAKTLVVMIDTEGPAAFAQPAAGRRGQAITLTYRVDDLLSPSATAVTVVVENSRGSVVARFAEGEQAVGAWHSVRWLPTVGGRYSYSVSATDLAGNRQVAAGSARVTVRSEWVVIGRSVRGRRIVAAQFGEGLRRILVIGGVHGDEAGTPVAARFAAYLATHPEAVPAGARIDVIRCLDPDGRALNTRGNARGVDLNRNLPTADWRGILRRGDPSALLGLSGGSRPDSEPETKALLAYLKQGFAVVVSLHSHAGVLDSSGPGGGALARRMSRLCGLPVGRLSYQAYITGSLGGYVPKKYGIPIVTVELRNATFGRGLRSALLVAAR